MAAFSRENGNLTWHRVKIALDSNKVKPHVKREFDALKHALAQDYRNAQLQFLTFTDAQAVAAGGTVLGTGAARLVAALVMKTGTSGTGTATDSFVKFYDDATDDTTASHALCALGLLDIDDVRFFCDADGYAIAAGVTVGCDTTISGTTDSTAGDAGPGFVIIR